MELIGTLDCTELPAHVAATDSVELPAAANNANSQVIMIQTTTLPVIDVGSGGRGATRPPPPPQVSIQVGGGGAMPPNFTHCLHNELHWSTIVL